MGSSGDLPVYNPENEATIKFGAREAREFLKKNKLPMIREEYITGAMCETLSAISQHITATSIELKELREQLKLLTKERTLLAEVVDEAHSQLSEARDRNKGLQQLVDTDELTGVGTRRGFNAELDRMLARRNNQNTGKRHKKEYPEVSVVMFDLDNFKGVNDVFGHPGGDEALKHVANTVKSKLRPGDYIVRWGGDEFAALLYDIKEDEAQKVAHDISVAVSNSSICYTDRNTNLYQRMPISITCATHQLSPGDTVESVVGFLSDSFQKKKKETKALKATEPESSTPLGMSDHQTEYSQRIERKTLPLRNTQIGGDMEIHQQEGTTEHLPGHRVPRSHSIRGENTNRDKDKWRFRDGARHELSEGQRQSPSEKSRS